VWRRRGSFFSARISRRFPPARYARPSNRHPDHNKVSALQTSLTQHCARWPYHRTTPDQAPKWLSFINRNLLKQRQPRCLLRFDERERLLGVHGMRIAAYIGEQLLKLRIADDLGEIGFDFGDDRLGRAARRDQYLPARRRKTWNGFRHRW